MNDFVIFGSTGLTGGYFLDEVKNRNLNYHLFVREVSSAESIENQTLFDSENLPELPNAKSLAICIGYPLDFLELIYMKLNVKKEFKIESLNEIIKNKLEKLSLRDAVDEIATETKLPRKVVYNEAIKIRNDIIN